MSAFKWSYSALSTFEDCPAKYKYRYVDKLGDPNAPKAPALERGIKIHTQVEDYLQGKAELPAYFKRFKGYIDEVKQRPGLCVEDYWALTRTWTPTTPKAADAWWRGKLDAYYRDGKTSQVIDWKTGKIYGSNRDQMKLYAATVMAKDAEVDEVAVDLVYFDVGESRTEFYNRGELAPIIKLFNGRVEKIESEVKWRPRPTRMCSYCDFHKSKGGPCPAP